MMQNVTNNNVVFNIANWYLQDFKMAFLPPSKRKKIIALSFPSFISIDQTQLYLVGGIIPLGYRVNLT